MNKTKRLAMWIVVLLLILAVSMAVNAFLIDNKIISIHRLIFSEPKVEISNNVLLQLNAVYSNITTEIPVCLAGSYNSSHITLSDLYWTEIANSSISSVEYAACPSYIGHLPTLATLHNHPSGSCSLSEQDMITYGSDLDNGQLLIGLYCPPNQGYMFWYMNSITAGGSP